MFDISVAFINPRCRKVARFFDCSAENLAKINAMFGKRWFVALYHRMCHTICIINAKEPEIPALCDPASSSLLPLSWMNSFPHTRTVMLLLRHSSISILAFSSIKPLPSCSFISSALFHCSLLSLLLSENRYKQHIGTTRDPRLAIYPRQVQDHKFAYPLSL